MAPSRITTSIAANPDASDTEDAAPEAVTLIQSKKSAKLLEEARQVAESDAKRRRKEKNRLRDKNLKRRARETRGTGTKRGSKVGESSDDGSANLEARMKRAMQEAEEEAENDDEETWEGSGDESEAANVAENEEGSDRSNLSSGEGESSESGSDDSMSTIEDEESDEDQPSLKLPVDPKLEYLPDHLFSQALSKKAQDVGKRAPVPSMPSLNLEPGRKRKRAKKRTTKDIILGSKMIRTISPKPTPISSAASRTLPPGKVKRFYESHLNLKSSIRSNKRHGPWVRKAANIGNMRITTLPAAHFVRNS